MSGVAGLLGTFFPLIVVALAAFGPWRGRQLWTFSLGAHLVSFACFFLVVLRFYSGDAAFDFSVVSPEILRQSPWSGAVALRWNFPAAALGLAVCTVLVAFHFIARDLLVKSRASTAGLAGWLVALLGVLGADHPLLFSVFFAGTLVPRLVFHGLDSRETRIEAVKETAFLSVIALLSLLVGVLAFSEPFRATLDGWFRIDGGDRVVLPGSIGICLLLLAAAIGSGLFPFHGNARRIFQLGDPERAVPLALQPLIGFTLLFRFGPASYPQELRAFGPALLGLFSVGIAYCAAGFLGARAARDRAFWLQQALSCFVAVGFFTLSVKGWHGAETLLFFECLAVPFLLLVLACHERRPGLGATLELGRYPAFALSTALAALFTLFLPVSVGFYGALLVIWSLVGTYVWPLPFLIFSMPVIAFAGVRIMHFRLGDRPAQKGARAEFSDLRGDELVAIVPLGLVLLVLGLVPRIVMGPMGNAVTSALKAMGF